MINNDLDYDILAPRTLVQWRYAETGNNRFACEPLGPGTPIHYPGSS